MSKEYGVDLIGTEALGIKRRKPIVLLLSTFLVLTLLLGACSGEDGGEAADVAPAAQDQQAAEATEVVEENDVLTETLEAAATETTTSDADVDDVTVITDTELITATEVTTDITVTTDTVVLEEQEITTVMTDTEVITNVVESTDSTTESESEVITDTEDLPAQTSEDEATPQPGQEGSQPQTGTAVAAFTGIEGSTGRSIRASTLLDANFETSDGDVGGEIQDLVIDIQNGQVLYVLLEYGGVLDVGDTDMPVPLSAFSWGSEDELVLNIDGQQLESFPGVGNDWPVPDDNNWDLDVRGFWEGIDIDTGFEAEQSMQGVRRASSLLGSTIAGGELGDRVVQDMIISVGEGRVSYVLISDAGAGADEGWYVVPFSGFDATAPEAGFTWNPDFDPTLLDGAPRFDMATLGETRVFDETYDDEWEGFWNDAGFPVTNEND